MVFPRALALLAYPLLSMALAAGCSSSSDPDADEPTSGGSAGATSGSGGKAGSPNAGGADAQGGRGAITIGSAGDGGASEPEPGCAKTTASAELVPTNFLFVIDASGSMNCNVPDGDVALAARCARFPIKEDPARPSKWEVTLAALAASLASLVDKPQVSAGLMLFPRGSECGVNAEPDVPVATLDAAQLASIQEALEKTSPQGETPIAGATILSYGHIAQRLVAGALSGNSVVILLTDGVETCAPSVLESLLSRDVPNARLFDIRTFVIGAPGSEAARSLLSEVAWQGGTAAEEACSHAAPEPSTGNCHLDMTTSRNFEAELAAAMNSIANTEAISCEIAVPVNPSGGGVDLDRVNVTFTPTTGESETIVNDAAVCASANGWQYSADRSRIVLCGDACSRVRSEDGELKVVLGCPTVIVH